MDWAGWKRVGLAGLAVSILTGPALAQSGPENLDAGKTPAQLFASDCSACHKSPQGLAKSGGLFGLTSFLREHYTASKETAAVLSAYLQSLGEAPAAPARSRQAKRPPKADNNKADNKPKTDESSTAGGGKKTDDKKSDGKKPDDKKAAGDAASADVKASESKPKSDSGENKKPPAAKPADGNSDQKDSNKKE